MSPTWQAIPQSKYRVVTIFCCLLTLRLLLRKCLNYRNKINVFATALPEYKNIYSITYYIQNTSTHTCSAHINIFFAANICQDDTSLLTSHQGGHSLGMCPVDSPGDIVVTGAAMRGLLLNRLGCCHGMFTGRHLSTRC